MGMSYTLPSVTARLRREELPPMPAPWRIEVKATAFSRWMVAIPQVHRLDDALSAERGLKQRCRYYATRIRAN